MKSQLKLLGLSVDWSREFATCDPAYYKHQQKMFLDFHRLGFVARKEANVNWDPVDHTVLANEQVIDGRGWRSGALVEQRKLTQWFFRISDMAEELLSAIDELDRWPDKVRLMQRNWIGRSEGARVTFELTDAKHRIVGDIHDAAGHVVRREFLRDRGRSSDRAGVGQNEQGARRFHRRMQAARHDGRSDRDCREDGLRHRLEG